MKNNFNKISESLDIIEPEVITNPEKKQSNKKIIKKNSEVLDEIYNYDKDCEYVRGNLYSLVEKGQEALTQIIDLAQQSDSPRAYEVAGQLIKNVGDVTDKLIDLHQKMKKIKEEEPRGPKNVTNALFVGSTADLQKMIKEGLIDSK